MMNSCESAECNSILNGSQLPVGATAAENPLQRHASSNYRSMYSNV